MIKYVKGNLLESDAEALVNTVNTVGVMGKGIALQFKNQYPINYKTYQQACKANKIQIGRMFVTNESTLLKGSKTIINFLTKTDCRKPSEYIYIEQGLKDLKQVLHINQIKSVALPPLGAGNGKLDWDKVKVLIENHLSDITCDVLVYEPNAKIEEVMRKERVKLTPARAMLLAVLYELVRNEEFISEIVEVVESEKPVEKLKEIIDKDTDQEIDIDKEISKIDKQVQKYYEKITELENKKDELIKKR